MEDARNGNTDQEEIGIADASTRLHIVYSRAFWEAGQRTSPCTALLYTIQINKKYTNDLVEGIITANTPRTKKAKGNHWRGGRILSNGYVYIHSPEHPRHDVRGYVPEHRLVMEAQLGRFLEPDEHVHHKDHDKENNDPQNLMITDVVTHGSMEGKRARGIPKLKARKIPEKYNGFFGDLYRDVFMKTSTIAKAFDVSTVCVHDTARRLGLPVRKKTGTGEVRFDS